MCIFPTGFITEACQWLQAVMEFHSNKSLSRLQSGFPLSKAGFIENVSISPKNNENQKDVVKFLQKFGIFETNQIELNLDYHQPTKMCENVSIINKCLIPYSANKN